MSSGKLTKLIGKASWQKVMLCLGSNPDQAKKPIVTTTWKHSTVYPLHQALSKTSERPIPIHVLNMLIDYNPKALDFYAFWGACENDSTTIDVMTTLFAKADRETLQAVRKEIKDLVMIALDNDNEGIIQVFLQKYPYLYNKGILYQACEKGSARSVEVILSFGVYNKIGIAGGLFERQSGENKSPLEVACSLFDENDVGRVQTLKVCIKYASALEPTAVSNSSVDVPFVVASIGWVSLQCYKKIFDFHANRTATEQYDIVSKQAIQKAVFLAYDMPKMKDFDHIPEIFQNAELIQACRNRRPNDVQRILQSHYENVPTGCETTFLRKSERKNALDEAIAMYNENDDKSCEVLRSCVQYLNAKKMGLKSFPCPNYPTVFAAIKFVPKTILSSLFTKYKHEMKTRDKVGKAAIKKILGFAFEGAELSSLFANRLDEEHLFPLHVRRQRTSLNNSMATINEAFTA